MKLLLLLPLFCLLSPAFGPVSAQDKRPVDVVTVEEGADALLPCALSSGLSVDQFDWRKNSGGEEKEEVFFYDKGSYYGHGRSDQDQSQQFRGRVEFFKERLQSGNASITILNTRLEDNGTYTCLLLKPEKREVNIRLNVGAAPVPYINMFHDRLTWRLLLCKVQGVPKPHVEWKNSAGDVLKSVEKHKNLNGRYYVELELNVTRSDNYTCVATQWDIYHQIHNKMEVSIPDVVVAVSKGDDALLPCLLDSKESIQNMVYSWKKDDIEVFLNNKGQVEEEEQFKGRVTHYQYESGNASIKIHNTKLSDNGRYICYSSVTPRSHIRLYVVGETQNKGAPNGWLVASILSVILVLVILAVIIGAVYHCYHRGQQPL